jgi:DNA-binding GntR family transcriptional regulator
VIGERYVRAHLEPEGRAGRAVREHTAVLKAWLARDGSGVEAAVGGHIAAALDDLRVHFDRERART